ncbi:hypothetical protein MASR2M70_17830 [Bacillota bacterium]
MEFLAEWRDDRYIKPTYKMDGTRRSGRFALSYYGRDDENVSMQQGDLPHSPEPVIIEGEVLLQVK